MRSRTLLTDEERSRIEASLIDRIWSLAAPRQFIVAYLPKDIGMNLPDGAPADLVRRVLRLCIDDGYAHTPAALFDLLSGLFPGDAYTAVILERIKTPPPARPDPFDDRILSNMLPFLDRRQTRAALSALIQDHPTKPIVVITGDKKTGKSYTAQFIDHLSGKVPKMLHCRVGIRPTEGASIGAKEISRDLIAYMNGDPKAEPPPTTNTDAYARELVNWVIAAANQGDTRWWLIIDGFTNNEMREDTRKFLIQLAYGITQGIARTRHRLIFLDFDRTILPLQPGSIAFETVGAIPRSEVKAFIEELTRLSGKVFDAEQITEKIVAGFGEPIDDLPELNHRLSDFITVVTQ